jgi:hypothetical protein
MGILFPLSSSRANITDVNTLTFAQMQGIFFLAEAIEFSKRMR